MSFPLSTALAVFDKFWCILFLVSFGSKYCLFSLGTSLIHWLFQNTFLVLRVYETMPCFKTGITHLIQSLFFTFSLQATGMDLHTHPQYSWKEMGNLNSVSRVTSKYHHVWFCSNHKVKWSGQNPRSFIYSHHLQVPAYIHLLREAYGFLYWKDSMYVYFLV